MRSSVKVIPCRNVKRDKIVDVIYLQQLLQIPKYFCQLIHKLDMKSLVEIKNFLAPSSKFDDQKFEFIFVLDRSGSMGGNNILLARRALAVGNLLETLTLSLKEMCFQLFLRSLPTTCMFNVVGFGSKFDKLFPNSVTYTEKTLETALSYAHGKRHDRHDKAILNLMHLFFRSNAC